MWYETTLARLLKIDYPIIQAPMAGSATVELAAEVSNAGGLGSLGCGEMSVNDLRTCVTQLRERTNRPFNLNFMVHPDPVYDREINASANRLVAPFYQSHDLDEIPTSVKPPFQAFNQTVCDCLLELGPPVVSFHFGLPATEMLLALRSAGCIILSSATTVDEAVTLEAAGVDAIIAQGFEAGGHRGSFEVGYEDVGIGGLALIPQIVDAVDVPVIAAGGIADGRGIAASLVLGATGVQLGSAFLSCPEAATSKVHRAAIHNAKDSDTRLTRAFSGRPARARNNAYMKALVETRQKLPDYPSMYNLSMPLHQNSVDNQSNFLLYGQAAALNRDLPAARLIQTLVVETSAIMP